MITQFSVPKRMTAECGCEIKLDWSFVNENYFPSFVVLSPQKRCVAHEEKTPDEMRCIFSGLRKELLEKAKRGEWGYENSMNSAVYETSYFSRLKEPR